MSWHAYQACDDQVQRLTALKALVQGYQHLIVRYCTAMLGDAAHGEEVAQEVFLGTYTAMRLFGQEVSICT
jgi:DNA-directed RNA polymerase specialized sigma24 family protein